MVSLGYSKLIDWQLTILIPYRWYVRHPLVHAMAWCQISSKLLPSQLRFIAKFFFALTQVVVVENTWVWIKTSSVLARIGVMALLTLQEVKVMRSWYVTTCSYHTGTVASMLSSPSEYYTTLPPGGDARGHCGNWLAFCALVADWCCMFGLWNKINARWGYDGMNQGYNDIYYTNVSL